MFSARRLAMLATTFVLLAGSGPARASDSMLDLVRELGAQAAPAAISGGQPRCGGHRRRSHRQRSWARPARRHRVRRSGARLTAAGRGSGRIDVIDISGPVSTDDRPGIERKPGW
jgi:hypothetical protein